MDRGAMDIIGDNIYVNVDDLGDNVYGHKTPDLAYQQRIVNRYSYLELIRRLTARQPVLYAGDCTRPHVALHLDCPEFILCCFGLANWRS